MWNRPTKLQIHQKMSKGFIATPCLQLWLVYGIKRHDKQDNSAANISWKVCLSNDLIIIFHLKVSLACLKWCSISWMFFRQNMFVLPKSPIVLLLWPLTHHVFWEFVQHQPDHQTDGQSVSSTHCLWIFSWSSAQQYIFQLIPIHGFKVPNIPCHTILLKP